MTDHLLPDELAMRERCDRATAGEWSHRSQKFDDWGMIRAADGNPVASTSMAARIPDNGPHTEWGIGGFPEPAEVAANAAFIAHARTDIPALLTRLAAERAEVERLRAELEKRT